MRPKKKDIHYRIALLLEDELKIDEDLKKFNILAYHFERSGNLIKAFEYYHKAALFFLDICGFDTALKYFRTAEKLYKENKLKDEETYKQTVKYIKELSALK